MKNLKTFKRIPIMGVVGILIAFHCSSHQTKPSDLQTIDLQGHRGARGLAPENTWPAFQKAIEYKMTTLELDTVLTKDGQVIIHHDSETNPSICSNQDGSPIQKNNLYELNLADLKKLDCGSLKNPKFPEQVPVPGTKLITIQEFFQKVATEDKIRKSKGLPPLEFNIETKFPGDNLSSVSQNILESHVKALVKAVEQYKVVDRTTIQSFYLPALPLVKKMNSKIKTSALFAPTYPQGLWMVLGGGSGYRKSILQKTSELNADIISPYFLYVDAEFMKEARDRKISVIPWTVNDKKEMYRLLSLGVDGIISDYPDRLSEVVSELKTKE